MEILKLLSVLWWWFQKLYYLKRGIIKREGYPFKLFQASVIYLNQLQKKVGLSPPFACLEQLFWNCYNSPCNFRLRAATCSSQTNKITPKLHHSVCRPRWKKINIKVNDSSHYLAAKISLVSEIFGCMVPWKVQPMPREKKWKWEGWDLVLLSTPCVQDPISHPSWSKWHTKCSVVLH